MEVEQRATSSRVEDTAPTHLRTAKQLRKGEIDKLVARYHETRNMQQLAREFKLSRATVARHLASRGVDTSRAMKPGDIARAVEMYAEGLSSATIGAKLGFDNRTVIREIRKKGVTIRPPVA